MQIYINETHDEERAFYGISGARLKGCVFDGEADGESALKETSELEIEDCDFHLRYPLWHTDKAVIHNCRMSGTCRAALWYDKDIEISGSYLGGIKALRESENITLKDCEINSTEFCWFCGNIKIFNCSLVSEYPFLKCSGAEIDGLKMTGKYSFQYTENMVIKNSELNTKDAFWHSKNVTVYDSVINGEYLAWYSENLRLVRCRIVGTQPLCYAKGLVLEDCETEGCDLSFEKSGVSASVRGGIMSVKNPAEGKITADEIGEIIIDDPLCRCEISVRNKV